MPQVIELFAGVGGFRVGLERVNSALQNQFYDTVWANQWEPATTTQHAWRTYERRFGEGSCLNQNISEVELNIIPNHDMLVGGFPCQDYSVARALNQAKGLQGKKGVLWWEIHRIVEGKGQNSPSVLFLENVDRLVNSPASQRGRDFAIILQSLADLGYCVEWRIINAAEYGMPQRRRRTYILAYKNISNIAQSISDPTDWIYKDGVFAKAFPVLPRDGAKIIGHKIMGDKDHDLADLTENFNAETPDKRVFESAGLMVGGLFYTCKPTPDYRGNYITLGDIVSKTRREWITDEFWLPATEDATMERWRKEKGGKKLERTSKEGFKYMYSEGGMPFPDKLDCASRTIVTGEGGKGASRFKHVIEDFQYGEMVEYKDGVHHRYRRLIPQELEQLDMFPINHTEGESSEKRAFFMGNALVCGIVERVGTELNNRFPW